MSVAGLESQKREPKVAGMQIRKEFYLLERPLHHESLLCTKVSKVN